MPRWLSQSDFDVDVFELESKEWMLFVYLKTQKISFDPDFAKALVAKFEEFLKAKNVVAFVSGALKTDGKSEPLVPIAIANREVPLEVWTKEGWVKLRLETQNVLNPGLFSDQELNRVRLVEFIQARCAQGPLGERDGLLNLFSYTGAFSVAAVAAGARFSTSVDVSSRYLDWERQNFEANFGGVDSILSRRICEDSREFLRRELKRESLYRWIVIDPPTFSRGKGKVFKVQDELLELAEIALRLLLPGGAILLSTNDARWSEREFYSALDAFAKKARTIKICIERGRVPKSFGANYPLKSAWILT